MPCPELGFGGTRRFWAVREQYDTPAYRAHCRRLAEPVAAQVRADLAAGARVVIIGIDGSPSMGVELTAADDSGRPSQQAARRGLPRDARHRPLHGDPDRAAGRDVEAVHAVGIGQDLFDYDERRELAKLGGILAGEGEPGAR